MVKTIEDRTYQCPKGHKIDGDLLRTENSSLFQIGETEDGWPVKSHGCECPDCKKTYSLTEFREFKV